MDLSSLEEYLNFKLDHPSTLLKSEDMAPHFVRPFLRDYGQIKFPNFIWNFSPSTDEYYSPLTPLYLEEIPRLEELKRFQTLFSRDGLIPLLWFFHKNPRPPSPTRILIQERLAPCVPREWREQMGTYHLCSRVQPLTLVKRDKILIHALVSKNFLPLSQVRSQLKTLQELIEKQNLFIKSIECFFSFRDDPYYRVETDHFICKFMETILKTLGKKVKFITNKQLLSRNSYADAHIFEIHQPFYSADNYLNYITLSRGGRPLQDPYGPQEAGSGDFSFVPLSAFHGLVIKDQLPPGPFSEKEEKEWEEWKECVFADKDPNQSHYWPKSFALYARKMMERI